MRGSNSRLVVEALAADPDTVDFVLDEVHEDGEDVVAIGDAAEAEGGRVAFRATVREGAITAGPDRADPESVLGETGLAETTARDMELVRRHYAAFNRADVEAIVETLRPDVEIVGGDERAGGSGRISRGHGEAARFFAEIKELVEHNQAEVLSLEARPGRVEASVRLHGTLRTTGESGIVPAVHFFTIADGLIARIETYRPDWRSHALADRAD